MTTVEPERRILVRTRTGKKIHLGWPGSSVTDCGHWLRVNGNSMRFSKAHVVKALARGEETVSNPSSLGPSSLILCEHCFGPNARSHAAAWIADRVLEDGSNA